MKEVCILPSQYIYISKLYIGQESKNYLRRLPGFDPITFTFSENSNYRQESLLFRGLLTTPNNVLPLHLKAKFPAYNLNFH